MIVRLLRSTFFSLVLIRIWVKAHTNRVSINYISFVTETEKTIGKSVRNVITIEKQK